MPADAVVVFGDMAAAVTQTTMAANAVAMTATVVYGVPAVSGRIPIQTLRPRRRFHEAEMRGGAPFVFYGSFLSRRSC